MEIDIEDYSDISFEINNTKLFFSTFTIYSILYFLAYTNLTFSQAITPTNFIKGHLYSHELISYGMSTIYNFITATCGILFVIEFLEIEEIQSVYYFSIGYLLADIIYIILTSNITKSYRKYGIIISHNIVTIYVLFNHCFSEDYVTLSRSYFLNLIFIGNYTTVLSNILWYIKNTNKNYVNDELYKLLLKILLIVYFSTTILIPMYIFDFI